MIYVVEQGSSAGREPEQRAVVLLARVAGCEPAIWRRLAMRESAWLHQLHDALQIAFDWFDYQTHEFVVGEARYGNPFNRDGVVVEDDRDVTLVDIGLAAAGQMFYRYHFDAGWTVEIRVEQTGPVERRRFYPVCLAGGRAGPPEDCGGAEAYNEMLAHITGPHTDAGQEWLEWLGPDYDPEKCDLAAINKALKERARFDEERSKAQG